MTFHHKLTEAERVDLRARGYQPVQVWLRPRDKAFWDEVLVEAREIAQAEDEAEVDLFIEASARETFQLINEMEEGDNDK